MRSNPHFLHFAVNFTLKVACIFVFFCILSKTCSLKSSFVWHFLIFLPFSPNVASLQFFVTCQECFANFCVTFRCFRETAISEKFAETSVRSFVFSFGVVGVRLKAVLCGVFCFSCIFFAQRCHLAIFCNLSGVFRKFCQMF